VYEQEGNPLPDRTLDSIRERGVAIKGPTTTPVGSGTARSTSRSARSSTSTLHPPCKAYDGVRTRFPETDIVIVRENTEDLYAGIEFEKGSDEVEKLRKFLAEELDSPTRDELRHLDQADLGVRLRADRRGGLQVREENGRRR
jgi:isocitrate dehydrogenase (NAD+)